MFPSAAKPFTASTALSVLHKEDKINRMKNMVGMEPYSLKTLGAYRVCMLYPSDCLVSPAMTLKSAPATAKMVPPFSV